MEIQRLDEDAKETLLAEGTLKPTMYLEFSVHSVVMVIEEMNDHQSVPVQCGVLARMALEECRKYPEETPIAAGFIAEAWVSKEPENDEQKMHPKFDPKKKEVLGAEVWTASNNACQFHRMEIIRDHKKRIVDIGEIEVFEGKMSWQLGSIAQGVKDSQRRDEDLIGAMETAIAKRVERMNPEQKRDLLEFGKLEGLPLDLIQRFL